MKLQGYMHAKVVVLFAEYAWWPRGGASAPLQPLQPLQAVEQGRGAAFQCGCGNTYRYERNLKMHQKRECGKEPSFACPHCPYRSKQKSHMKRHVRCKHGDTSTVL